MALRVIPWWTDPAVAFIEGFLESVNHAKPIVFEYGGGNSTIYFAQKSLNVTTIEHDVFWYNKLLKLLDLHEISTANVDIRLAPRPYHKQIDVIVESFKTCPLVITVVDGRDRVKCIEYSSALLAYHNMPHVIILDNAERLANEYRSAEGILHSSIYQRRYHFEQPSVVVGGNQPLGVLPDRSGWKAPHRWITSIYFSEHFRDFTHLGRLLIAG